MTLQTPMLKKNVFFVPRLFHKKIFFENYFCVRGRGDLQFPPPNSILVFKRE